MCGDEYFTVEVLAAVVEAVIPSVIRVISVDDEAVVSDEPDVSIAVIVVAVSSERLRIITIFLMINQRRKPT